MTTTNVVLVACVYVVYRYVLPGTRCGTSWLTAWYVGYSLLPDTWDVCRYIRCICCMCCTCCVCCGWCVLRCVVYVVFVLCDVHVERVVCVWYAACVVCAPCVVCAVYVFSTEGEDSRSWFVVRVLFHQTNRRGVSVILTVVWIVLRVALRHPKSPVEVA